MTPIPAAAAPMHVEASQPAAVAAAPAFTAPAFIARPATSITVTYSVEGVRVFKSVHCTPRGCYEDIRPWRTLPYMTKS